MLQVTVLDIYNKLNEIAEFKNHDVYDNVGILIGSKEDRVTKILLALDITQAVADEAIRGGYDCIVTHHPLIFNGLKSISSDSIYAKLLKKSISHIAAHTNLDMAKGGVSDIMAQLLGLKNTGKVFEVKSTKPYYQLSVFVPKDYKEEVYNACISCGAGSQGAYSGCAFSSVGEGRFVPLENSHAFIGEVNKTERVVEERLEMLIKPSDLKGVIQAMRNAHPYEEPAFSICENKALFEETGYGKICECEEMTASELATLVKEKYNCSCVRYIDGKRPIKTVALCSGAGSSQTPLAISKGVDAYITGDVKHSDFIDSERAGLTLIDGGHFHTENIVLPYLKNVLSPLVDVQITNTGDPLSYIK